MKTCAVEGCERPSWCRGFCRAHYTRWSRHGDPGGPTFQLRGAPVEERFWSYVLKLPNGCWEWQGGKVRYGYGGFHDENHRLRFAHRYSWEMHNGPIPKGLFVCHTCDNPPCINPAHLFIGTPKDNTQDMIRKGRSAQGQYLRDRTHCVRGHEFTASNTRLSREGKRVCRECEHLRWQRRKESA